MHLIIIIAAGVFGGLWLFTRWSGWRLARLERQMSAPLTEARMRSNLRSNMKAEPEAHRRFHEAGMAAYPDWCGRCIELGKAGVGQEFEGILYGYGVELTFALSNDLPAAKALARRTRADLRLGISKFAAACEIARQRQAEEEARVAQPPPPAPAQRPTWQASQMATPQPAPKRRVPTFMDADPEPPSPGERQFWSVLNIARVGMVVLAPFLIFFLGWVAMQTVTSPGWEHGNRGVVSWQHRS